uniref:PRA1 family protein n=1 Tax=Emiliania huxleyi TaxID=2903 RepID=A0A6U8Q8C9_EMIHU
MAIAVSPPSRHPSPRCCPLTLSRHPILPLSPQALYTLLSSWWLCIGAFAICGTWGFAYGMRREAASLDIAGVPVPKPLACGGASLLLMLLTGMISAFAYAAVLGAVVALPHAALHKVPEAGGFDEESAALNAAIPAASIVA